ncbi:hypothetical protein SAMN02949497_2478 [Methylomagnum ishizawai]|uniref:Colicin import membrane protein n=1 Tax=Methylomagnum ishizawai TaxID=1760988 RepID=A0A1Y6D3L9_9GAMM|nr:hypothetical protein [Methylomagnum ishizawai]SMF95132.1 hypothetical protein SAMN02949497_2478 [Methylomagnum ishizawai]
MELANQHGSRAAMLALCAALLLAGGAAGAAPKSPSQDAGLKEVLRKAQGVLHQLSAEKAALEAEKASLLGEKAALETQVKTLEQAVRKLEPLPAQLEQCKKTGTEALQSAKADFDSRIEQAKGREQTLMGRQRDIVAQAKDIQADNQLLVEAVKEREQWIAQCGERNRSLLSANQELVEKYKEKGFWDQVTDLEPLTGLGKVQTENAAEDYRYKLHQLKATPFQPAVAPQENPPAPAAVEEEGTGEQP